MTNTTNSYTGIIVKSIVALATNTSYLSDELHERRTKARRFIRGLAKYSILLDCIESQPKTIREVDMKLNAESSINFIKNKLTVDCIAFGLPTNLDLVDDTLFELFGSRSERIAQTLPR